MRVVRLTKNVVLSLLGAAFVWFFAVSMPFRLADWDSGPFSIKMGAMSLLGWIPMIVGGCVFIWCYCLFVLIGQGTPWQFDPPKKLVIAGPYRFVRNPMEGSFLLIVLGEALLFASTAVLLYWLVGFALLHIRQVLIEEPALRTRFGRSYVLHCRSVPRWVPRLKPYAENP
jgi:protein-S-isoprenylcysteine O-methyltransferase Ste14